MPAPEKRRYYRVHIAFLIMIFTLKQGISIGSLQKLLPSPTDEEGVVAAFYTNYIQQVREIGSFYTAQTRAAVQDILGPPGHRPGAGGEVPHPEHSPGGVLPDSGGEDPPPPDADPAAVLAQETIRDHQGRHPMDAPEEED